MKHFVRLAFFFSVLALLSTPATATQVATCTPTFTVCEIPENIMLQFPSGFLAISGDVVLLEPNLVTVSDVFRIFNNLVDTGAGTGLGDLAFLYSSDDSTPLPNSSTYSANVVRIQEDPSGITQFNSNGTDYVLAAPEPSTFALLALGLAALAGATRRQLPRTPFPGIQAGVRRQNRRDAERL